MRKILYFLALCAALVFSSSQAAFAEEERSCDHGTKRTKDNFFPYFRLNLTPVSICDNSAVSFLGEIGSKIYRINGSYGAFYGDCHRLKVGGEFLGEKFHYNFSSGRVHRWTHQWAAGGKYQYLVDDWFCFLEGIQLTGSYSRATSHSLSSVLCETENETISRRIAGASNWNVEGGLIISPWECARLIGTVGYDSTDYHRHFSHDKRVRGVSGSVWFVQRLWDCFVFDVKGEFRKAYNYLEGRLAWNDNIWDGDVSIAVFGGYTWGKEHLPSSSNAGVELRYAWNRGDCCNTCCDPCASNDCCPNVCNDLADWLVEPAVYMPTVLAIAEESSCAGPTSDPFGPLTFNPGISIANISTNFHSPNGLPITFTASNLPTGVTLTTDGFLLVENPGTTEVTARVTITGTTDCGSTSQTITIVLFGGD